MRLLLDTHLLLWLAQNSDRLSSDVRDLIEDKSNDLLFSVVSLWEIVIKANLRRQDFEVEPALLRRGLIENSYAELDVRAEHVFTLIDLPRLHRDPFDHLLIAQAIAEDATLITSDRAIARYPGKIRLV